jgi:hypothetical protein
MRPVKDLQVIVGNNFYRMMEYWSTGVLQQKKYNKNSLHLCIAL